MKIITIVGARPQFVKAAAVSRAIKSFSNVEEIIIHTGQHFDYNMSEIFFEEMEIPKPKYNLGVSSLTHGAMTGKMLEGIEEILLKEKPDFVLVYGDTNSTIAGALAASKLHIPIAHVEAGLRSFNKLMPEEVNRVLTDHISDILFCPTGVAEENLKNEGISGDKVKVVGDVMLDASLHYLKKKRENPQIKELRKKEKMLLCTIHRQETTADKKVVESLIKQLSEFSENYDVVLPIHPRTRKILGDSIDTSRLIICDPVSYFEMLDLLERATYVITDSGGLQKEAHFFKKPCITMRNETEWKETLLNGCNVLVGTSAEKLKSALINLEKNEMPIFDSFYGDGESSKAIIQAILDFK